MDLVTFLLKTRTHFPPDTLTNSKFPPSMLKVTLVLEAFQIFTKTSILFIFLSSSEDSLEKLRPTSGTFCACDIFTLKIKNTNIFIFIYLIKQKTFANLSSKHPNTKRRKTLKLTIPFKNIHNIFTICFLLKFLFQFSEKV